MNTVVKIENLLDAMRLVVPGMEAEGRRPQIWRTLKEILGLADPNDRLMPARVYDRLEQQYAAEYDTWSAGGQ